ncbi:MAG: hypothetical protein QM715_04055 [Nibricoccus sp.]
MRKGKIIWEGVSWFVVGIVVDLGVMILTSPAFLFPDVHWPLYVASILVVATPFALASWAVIREIRRQEKQGITRIPPSIEDSVLGELVHEGDEWNGRAFFGSTEVGITVYSEGLPNPILLQRARSLVQDADQFLRRLAAFKEEEIKAQPRMAEFAEEIRGLTLFSITFYDPPEPESGFIAYSGMNDKSRMWHSSLEAGNPVGLGFDR